MQMPRNRSRGPGGSAGPDLCPTHRVPLVHPTGGEALCAVCEHATVLVLLRKIGHGCADATCPICDKESPP